MFNKILVCLDGSPLAEKVLPYAIDQAQHYGSEVVLFRVVSEPSLISLALPGMPGVPVETAGMERQIKEEEKQVESYLAALADRIRTENKVNVSYDSSLGEAGDSIVEYADDNQVELIAIATHGRSGPGRVVLGSVADYVIRNTRLPVLLIRPLVEKSK
jgi:nucleotide-binding universal stress UspA family protein